MRLTVVLLFAALCLPAAEWLRLLNGKNLDGWQQIGDGVWTVLDDGTLVGQRKGDKPPFSDGAIDLKTYTGWDTVQAWLYTVKEYRQFDLELEYWLRVRGNSGISLRDPSRAKYGVTMPPDFSRTPSKLGYEIQLNNLYPDKYPSGSIYTFASAKPGAQRDNQWNKLRIESRDDMISVFINGQKVAEHAGDPQRPKTGPIGLQLHDQLSVVMFRNIRLREVR
jgi:hypothetical protein